MNIDLIMKENIKLNEECQRYKEMWFTTNNSLAKYRKLEKELGCPLDVLFKALKDGIYHDENFEHPVLILDENSFKKNSFNLMVIGTIVYLKDYKKTWWLKADRSE